MCAYEDALFFGVLDGESIVRRAKNASAERPTKRDGPSRWKGTALAVNDQGPEPAGSSALFFEGEGIRVRHLENKFGCTQTDGLAEWIKEKVS